MARGIVKDRGNGYPQLENESFETLVADAAATLSAAQLLGGFLRQVPTAARALTTDTGTNIDAAMPNAKVGDTFSVVLFNNSGGANAITFVAGAGVTLKPSASISVAQNKTCQLVFVKTGAATYDCYQILGA